MRTAENLPCKRPAIIYLQSCIMHHSSLVIHLASSINHHAASISKLHQPLSVFHKLMHPLGSAVRFDAMSIEGKCVAILAEHVFWADLRRPTSKTYAT